MTLPVEFAPLPFAAGRGLPQTVPYVVGSHSLRVTLAAAVTDLPALLQSGATYPLLDLTQSGHTPLGSTTNNVRRRFQSRAPSTLSPEVIRPVLIVRDGEVVIGSRPACACTYLAFGRTEQGALLVELYVDSLVLTSGAFTQPGDVGSSIVIGARSALKGSLQSERGATGAPGAMDSTLFELSEEF